MPFVVPKIVGFEQNQAYMLITESCKPSEETLKKYIEWLYREMEIAKTALAELYDGATVQAAER